MTREILITTLRRIIAEIGYTPYTGFGYRINTELNKMPAVWILPPKLISQEGLKQGVKRYEVCMNIVARCKINSQAENEQQWAVMERDMTKIVCTLGNDQSVRAITKLKYQAEEFSLTNRAEVSLKASFVVELPFCNE